MSAFELPQKSDRNDFDSIDLAINISNLLISLTFDAAATSAVGSNAINNYTATNVTINTATFKPVSLDRTKATSRENLLLPTKTSLSRIQAS